MIVNRGVGDITLNPTDQGFLSQAVPLPMWLILFMTFTVLHATWRMGK